jgi:hypothetical protein
MLKPFPNPGRHTSRLLGVTVFWCLAGILPVTASSLKVSAGSAARLAGEVEGDYTTTHLFLDELASQAASRSIPITIFFVIRRPSV